MAGLPSKLRNWNVFVDGTSYAGIASEISLGKIAEKLDQWRGAGMLGDIDVAMGLEKLEIEHKYGGLVVPILRQFGALGSDASQLRFVGAYQEDVAGGVVQAELVVRGRHVEIDLGTAKPGEANEWAVKSSCPYYRWRVAGRTELEVDIINNVFVVGGIDRMAAIRAAIGQ
jgi:P2 family phage contractile tail tube protein